MTTNSTDRQDDLIDRLLADMETLDPQGFQGLCSRDDVRRHQIGHQISRAAASTLIDLLIRTLAGLKAAQVTDEQRAVIEALRDNDGHFAHSIVTQFETRGTLSERQWEAAARVVATAADERPPVPQGIHILGGTYYKVQEARTGSGRLYAKEWQPGEAKGTWEYRPGVVNTLSAATVVSAQEAAEFGRLYSVCCFCTRDLTDERSIAVGYGPVCSEIHGLPWGHVAKGQDARPQAVRAS